MKLLALSFTLLLFACSCKNAKDEKAELKTEYDKTQELTNLNLTKLDSLTGAMQDSRSFTMEKYAAAVNMKDSLYRLLDSLLARKNILDSLLEKK